MIPTTYDFMEDLHRSKHLVKITVKAKYMYGDVHIMIFSLQVVSSQLYLLSSFNIYRSSFMYIGQNDLKLIYMYL